MVFFDIMKDTLYYDSVLVCGIMHELAYSVDGESISGQVSVRYYKALNIYQWKVGL
jgi:hypothetical protein